MTAALAHRSDVVSRGISALLLAPGLSDQARDDALRLRATLQREQQQREQAAAIKKRNAERRQEATT